MQLPAPLSRLRMPTWLIKAAIVLALIGYCLAIGAAIGKGSTRLMLLIAAPPLLAVGGIVIFRYFQLLVLALPLLALTLPRIELPTGTETRLPLSLLLALALSLAWAISMYSRGWRLAPTPLNRPLIAFGLACSFSLFWGIAWRDYGLIDAPKFIVTQTASLITILISLSAALLVGNFIRTPGQLKYLVGAFLVCGSLMTLTELFHINQPVLNDRGLWGTWTVAPAYGLLIGVPRMRWRWRIGLILIILLTLYQTMVVNADWISGWLPTIIALGAITLLRSWKAFILLCLLGGVALFISLGFFQKVAQDNVDDGSLERLIIWEQNFGVTREHWLFGTGPAGYAIYYMSYFPEEARSTHNNYLDVISQFGLVGSLLWLWLMAVSMWEGWHISRRAPPGFLRALAITAGGGWVAALAAMFFGDWVLPFAYNQGIAGYKYTVYSWIFLGTLISIRQLLADQPTEVTS